MEPSGSGTLGLPKYAVSVVVSPDGIVTLVGATAVTEVPSTSTLKSTGSSAEQPGIGAAAGHTGVPRSTNEPSPVMLMVGDIASPPASGTTVP